MKEKNMWLVAIFSFFLAIFISASPVKCAVWYVRAEAPAGGDGKSWTTAFNNIQKAIDKAYPFWIIGFSPKDQIWVKSGRYNLSDEIKIYKAVSIYGGFNGTETRVSQRDWENNETIIDGLNEVRCINITQIRGKEVAVASINLLIYLIK